MTKEEILQRWIDSKIYMMRFYPHLANSDSIHWKGETYDYFVCNQLVYAG